MECTHCGGLVVWMGRPSNLTHTQCQRCGAVNCQRLAPEDEPVETDTGIKMTRGLMESDIIEDNLS